MFSYVFSILTLCASGHSCEATKTLEYPTALACHNARAAYSLHLDKQRVTPCRRVSKVELLPNRDTKDSIETL